MNCVQRTIAAEMARPIPVRMCLRGCGMPAHHGGCKGEERFAMVDGVRRCAMCPHRLANSNPGPLCRGCQAKALQEGIAEREQAAIGGERPAVDKPRRYVPGPRQAVAEIPRAKPPAGEPGVRTIRIADIPGSAENRLESRMGEWYSRLMTLGDGEALVIPCENKRQLRNTCERLRNRLKNANAGRLRWKRDGLTLYAWRDRGAK